MPSLAALMTGIIVLAASAGAAPTAEADPATHDRIRRVETGMPSVAKQGGTVELSLQEWMEALRVPGVSVAVIDDYKIVWAKGYGLKRAGQDDGPVTADTLFQAASISKPVAALALMHHVERETFELDADVNTYLRAWKLPDGDRPGEGQVSLRHLLAHTAGITPGGFAGYERGATLPSITEILDGTPPATNEPARRVAEAGASVSYSGLGYTIIQLTLQDRLGKPFETIVEETVFDPLGMRDSTFARVLPEALAKRAAHGHRATGAAIEGGWYVYPELAAAGLWTTPSDLARLVIEVARSKAGTSSRILSTRTARAMLTQQMDEMALGFVIRPEGDPGYFAHSGGNQGYRCRFEMFADTGQGVVVMTNSDAGGLLTALLARSVAAAYDWPAEARRTISPSLTDAILRQLEQSAVTRTKVAVAPATLARYAGRYELAPDLVFDVSVAEGHLDVQLGDQPRFPVYPESEVKFFYEVVDAQLTFVEDRDGRIVSLILHQGGADREARRID